MTDIDLIKQALEYLEDNQHHIADHERHTYVMMYNDCITALKARLAQPEQEPTAKYSDIVSDGGLDPRNKMDAQPAQEPVARVSGTYGGRFTYDPINRAMILPIGMALYAAPIKEKNG